MDDIKVQELENLLVQDYEGNDAILDNKNGMFQADDVEEFKLQGNYMIKRFKNTMNSDQLYTAAGNINSYHAKLPFAVGNVLFNRDVPNIENLIKLIIYYTYTDVVLDRPDTPKPVCIKMIEGGSICPTKEDILEYNGQIFTLYGRYIYGHCERFVTFQNTSDENITFTLDAISYKSPDVGLGSHNYAFTIVDKNTKVLNAFGLHR